MKGGWIALTLSFCILTGWGQGVWDDPFESTRKTHDTKAWTLSVGTNHFHAVPTSWNSSWVLNHGTAAAPKLDTLHNGLWNSLPSTQWRVGLGHLWMLEDRLWSDRLHVDVGVSRTVKQEQFLGRVKEVNGTDSVLVVVEELLIHEGQSWALDGQIHLLSAVATGPDGFVEWSTGVRAAWIFQQQIDTMAPIFFAPAILPAWHVAWTAGVGVGFKVYRGRMLRLHVEADWLQLAQARTADVVRVVYADVRGLNWMQGGYRPWRVTLTHDLFRRKPAENCANPTRSEASKTLFDPKKMKGGKKAKSKGFKKALEEREDWLD